MRKSDKEEYVYVVRNESGESIGVTESKKAAKKYVKYNRPSTMVKVPANEYRRFSCLPLHEYVTPEGRIYALDDAQMEGLRDAYSDHLIQLLDSISKIIGTIPAIQFKHSDLDDFYESLKFLNEFRFYISVDQYPYIEILDIGLMAEFYSMRILRDMSHEKYIDIKLKDFLKEGRII